ncbi:MAG: STAS domain-containing protein [bacterium]
MDIQHKTNDGYVTLLISGRLDATSAVTAEQQIAGVIDGGASRLLIDLSGLEFISSAGLRVLLVVAKKMARQNGKIALCGLQKAVMDVFEISGFLSIFRITADKVEAVSFFAET